MLSGVSREFTPLIGEPLLVSELMCIGPTTEFTVSVLSCCGEIMISVASCREDTDGGCVLDTVLPGLQ